MAIRRASDLPITLWVDGVFYQEAESDGQGIALFSVPTGLTVGDHVLLLQAKGKHGFRDSWLQQQLTVQGVPSAPLAPPPVAAIAATVLPKDDASATGMPAPALLPTLPPVVDNIPVAATLAVMGIAPPVIATDPPLVAAPVTAPPAAGVTEPVATAAPLTVPTATVAPSLIPTVGTAAIDISGMAAPWPVRLSALGLSFGAGLLVMFLLLTVRRGWRALSARLQSLAQIRGQLTSLHVPGSMAGQPMSNFQSLLLNHVWSAKWGLLCALASMVGSAVTDLISPWPLKLIFDYILLQTPLPTFLEFLSPMTTNNPLALLAGVAVTIVLIALLQSGFAYLENYMTTRAGYELVNTLRRELFLHFQRLSLTFHTESKRGELVFHVADDAQTLRDAFADSALSLVTQVLTIVGMFVIMFYVNWQLSLIPLLTFPLLFLIYTYLQGKLKASVRTLRKKEGDIAARLTENLSIMPVIQAFGREAHEATRFDAENSQNLESGIQIARLSAALNRTISVVSEVGLAAVVFVGAWLALRGEMTPGDVLIFITYVRTLYKPIRQMVKMSTKLHSAWVAAQRIAAVLDIEPTVQDKPDALVVHTLHGDIRFDGVGFQYKAGRPVLHDVSFHVQSGQRVALVGPSGAGKSTITSLLLRLYDPGQGAITIDGVDLRDYQRTSLRQQIGLVLQDALLFGATIWENICYGKPDATQAEVEAAARQAHIHDFIATLPKGYETQLGEMGSNLSGGQRQRIAIARALVKDPAILILDEPTSALDAESKALVDATINGLQGHKTVIVIAHHLASIQHFDQILVLDQGRVVEQGRHPDLVAKGGIYAELYRLQQQPPTTTPVAAVAPPVAPAAGHFMPVLAGAD
ncbi:MAG: ABC transporter ATP-binding protein [Caldilineaceae bacterium]